MSRVLAALIFSLVVAHASASSPPRPTKCPANSDWRDCGSRCEPTCDGRERSCDRSNRENCKRECRCLDGWVRNTETNECCRREDCPRRPTTTERPVTKRPEPKCRAGEVLGNRCEKTCEPTCKNRNPKNCPKTECTDRTRDCRCKDGRVRSDSGECIRPKDCPRPTRRPTEPKCGVNEEMGTCARNCERNCKNPWADDCKKCESLGCRCKKGYLRDDNSGKCVREGKCTEQKCTRGGIWAECGNQCQGTCDNTDIPKTCPKSCPLKGCRCDRDSGLVWNTAERRCVRVKDCPKKPHRG